MVAWHRLTAISAMRMSESMSLPSLIFSLFCMEMIYKLLFSGFSLTRLSSNINEHFGLSILINSYFLPLYWNVNGNLVLHNSHSTAFNVTDKQLPDYFMFNLVWIHWRKQFMCKNSNDPEQQQQRTKGSSIVKKSIRQNLQALEHLMRVLPSFSVTSWISLSAGRFFSMIKLNRSLDLIILRSGNVSMALFLFTVVS